MQPQQPPSEKSQSKKRNLLEVFKKGSNEKQRKQQQQQHLKETQFQAQPLPLDKSELEYIEALKVNNICYTLRKKAAN